MKYLLTFFAAIILFIQPAYAGNLSKIDKAFDGLYCGMETSPDWEYQWYDPQGLIFEDYTKRKIFGEVERTLILTSRGKLEGVGLRIGQHTDDSTQKAKAIRYLTKRLGDPDTAYDMLSWVWEDAEIHVIDMWPQEEGTVISLYCPE